MLQRVGSSCCSSLLLRFLARSKKKTYVGLIAAQCLFMDRMRFPWTSDGFSEPMAFFPGSAQAATGSLLKPSFSTRQKIFDFPVSL